MRTTLTIEFSSPTEMADFLLGTDMRVSMLCNYPETGSFPEKKEEVDLKPIVDFMLLEKKDIPVEKQEDFEKIKPAADALIRETFGHKPDDILEKIVGPHTYTGPGPKHVIGICSRCQQPFDKRHNRVKWCDPCREIIKQDEALKKSKRTTSGSN